MTRRRFWTKDRSKRAWERLVIGVAFLYPAAILVVAASLRFVGERWWLTGVGLYFPRYAFVVPLPFVTGAVLLTRRARRLVWTQAIAALALIFPLMGFVVPWPVSASRDRPSTRVLSYNMAAAIHGVDPVMAEIDRFAPDIVVLQEIGSPDTLTTALRARYPNVALSGQFGIATRYPVVSSFDPPPFVFEGRTHSPRFFRQVLDTPLGRVTLYDMHPISPREGIYALFQHGVKREILTGHLLFAPNKEPFVTNAGLRAAEVGALADTLATETGPLLISGDTNLPGLSRIFHQDLARYDDGFTQAGAGFGYTYPTNHGIPWMRIDRILTNDALRVVRFQIGTSLASDHYCIVADVQSRH